ncbi:hypothetical protein [Mycetocola manganoxydans]|uniref:hypothetical protein n=1 Tax=Mycetocola manganoxydans TaxID=699879 RepID=UPI0019AC2F1F|nr:hypothetical protein [Mycetocola manganoxydans]GHD39106.1 hypothetical protein GCM10008097_01430 [Mycetocola manganoxydans]
MTPLPDEQPLSRRQLREQQRTTESSDSIPTPPRRVSTTSPVPGGDVPEVEAAPEPPALSTDQVAVLEEAQAQGRPLTRRQARDLERVRTSSMSTIPATDSQPQKWKTDAAPRADATAFVDETPTVTPETSSADEEAPLTTKQSKAEKKNAKRNVAQANRAPSFVPSAAVVAPEADVVDAEIVPAATDDEPSPAVDLGDNLPEPPVESAFGPAATAQMTDEDLETEPKLSSSFGASVLSDDDSTAAALAQPFDQIIARGLEEAGNGVSTSSIVLPSMPNGQPLTGPLSANGNVVITGSIDLPAGIGSSGGNSDHFDKSDIDAMFDAEDDARPATAGTPVSASKAVSTHTATRDVINPPAPARSNRLLLILAITAGVLAVAVLSVIVVGIATGAFQSR